MTIVVFRTYRQCPSLGGRERRERARALRIRFANLLASDPDKEDLAVALRDAWLFCGAIARTQEDKRSKNFSDDEIRTAAPRREGRS